MKSSKTVDEIVKNTILTELSILTKISILMKISILTKISIWQKYQFWPKYQFWSKCLFRQYCQNGKTFRLWINNIKSLILSYIVNSQTCELERNARLMEKNARANWPVRTPMCPTMCPTMCPHPGPPRQGKECSHPTPVGSSGHCLSSAEQKGAASILDKGGIHVGSWRHPCWIWRKAQLYIMEGQHGRKPVSAQPAKAKQP